MVESAVEFPRGVSKDNLAILIAAVAAALVCILAYGTALQGPLFFDDVPNLLDNNRVQISGGTFDDWRVAALSSDSGFLYRPLSMLTFALNHALSGHFSALSLKSTNLAVHLAIAGFIYGFTLSLLQTPALRALRLSSRPETREGNLTVLQQRQLLAALTASIWLLHPIHVSTVLYAVQRMAQLSTLFTLAGLLLFTRYRLRWAEAGATTGEVIAALLWLLILGILAVLCKENGALLPWLIAVVEVSLFRGIWRGQVNSRLAALGWSALVLPVVALAAVFLFSPDILAGRFAGREFSLPERLLTQGRLLWHYLGWLAVPNIMDMGFFHDDIAISRGFWSPMTTGLALCAWLGVGTAALLCHRKYPLFTFALLFYLVAHSMESSVLPLEMVFEHRNYLPSVGIFLLVAAGILHFAARFQALRLRVVLAIVLGVLVILLGVRAHIWSDEMTLTRFDVVAHPGSARANFSYGAALYKRFEQAGTLGLPEAETRALAVAARHYFQQMLSIDKRDFAALVMLYQLDTSNFPELAKENDWLGQMQLLAQTRRLRASDRGALDALVRFSASPPGAPDRARVQLLLDQLAERYPTSMDLLAQRYTLLKASGAAPGQLQALLEHGAQLNPNSREVAAFLAEYHGSDHLELTYEAIRNWMQRDPLRRDLGAIRRIFVQ